MRDPAPKTIGDSVLLRFRTLLFVTLLIGACSQGLAESAVDPIPLLVELHAPFKGPYFGLGATQDGALIVGGEGNIGIYDGLHWRHIRIYQGKPYPILVKGERIWVGSNNEIGWISTNPDDNRYHVTTTLPVNGALHFFDLGSRFVALCSERILLLSEEGKTLDQYVLPRAADYLSIEWGTGWIIRSKQDAFFLTVSDRLNVTEKTPVPADVLLKDLIYGAVPIGERIFLPGRGMSYFYKRGELMPVNSPLWTDTKSQLLFNAFSWGEDSTLIRQGAAGGLEGFDPETLRPRWHLRVGEELNGGSGWDPITTPAGLFLGTDKGLYWLPSPQNFRRLSGSREGMHQVVSAQQGGFWLCTTNGSRRVPLRAWAAEDAVQIATWSVAETSLGRARGHANLLSLGDKSVSFGGISFTKLVESKGRLAALQFHHLSLWNADLQAVGGFDLKFSPTSMAALPSGDIFISSYRDGVFRWNETGAPQNVRRRGAIQSAVYTLGSALLVLWSDGLLEIDDQQIELPQSAGLTWDCLAIGNGYIVVGGQLDDSVQLLLVKKNARGSYETTSLDHRALDDLGGIYGVAVSDDRVAIAAQNQCIEIALSEFNQNPIPTKPRIAYARAGAADQGASSLRPLTSSSARFDLSATQDEVRFILKGGLEYWKERPHFYYRLSPDSSDWTDLDPTQEIALQRIATGRHVLEIESRKITGTATSRYEIIRPPYWYRSQWAYGSYALGLLGFGIATGFWRNRRLQRRARILEERVEQRTDELKKANKAKDVFLASMSHEIRNPLNGVIGISGMMREAASGERERRLAESLNACADQLRLVLDDILDFSLIERGDVQLQITAFDPQQTIRAAVLAVDAMMERTRLHFLPGFPEQVAIKGDGGKIRQVISNLVANAHKYGMPPEAEVEVSLAEERLTIVVSNTGPDIPPEEQTRIFDSFERGRAAKDKSIRGVGLGLTICSRFAQAMGGTVTLVSQNGLTRFTFIVPVQIISDGATPSAVTASAAIGRSVLAIEDEPYNRLVFAHVLRPTGCQIEWAQNGTEALEYIRSGRKYDLIFTDWMLPDIDGATLVRSIKTLLPTTAPAIVAVTAYATAEKRAEAFAAGVTGFITKPITSEKIVSVFQFMDGTPARNVESEPRDEPLQLGILLGEGVAKTRIAEYRHQLLSAMREIKSAIEQQDSDRAGQTAHRLVAQLLAIHHHTFAGQVRALEIAVQQVNWDRAAVIHSECLSTASDLIRTLDALESNPS